MAHSQDFEMGRTTLDTIKTRKMSTRREYNHAHQTQVTMNIATQRNRTRASARSVSARVDVTSYPVRLRAAKCGVR